MSDHTKHLRLGPGIRGTGKHGSGPWEIPLGRYGTGGVAYYTSSRTGRKHRFRPSGLNQDPSLATRPMTRGQLSAGLGAAAGGIAGAFIRRGGLAPQVGGALAGAALGYAAYRGVRALAKRSMGAGSKVISRPLTGDYLAQHGLQHGRGGKFARR